MRLSDSVSVLMGTTGSGKSEFLQAFILSMAINYSPKEVAFVLVDFKGGDMARPFMAKPFSPALPHLAATISNLSGNVLYRALVSLEAEIKSRQRIFNEAAAELGVDKLDINSYHKYYKGGRLSTPLPHLIIIIDEFAQLKTQQPEFLAQLINVIAPITTIPGGGIFKQAIYHPFHMLSKYGHGTVKKAIVDAPKYQCDLGELNVVEPAVIYNEENDEVRIFVLNCDQEEDVEFEVDLQGYGDKKVKKHLVLAGNDYSVMNTIEHPDAVEMEEKEVTAANSVVLPKMSWNVIVLG